MTLNYDLTSFAYSKSYYIKMPLWDASANTWKDVKFTFETNDSSGYLNNEILQNLRFGNSTSATGYKVTMTENGALGRSFFTSLYGNNAQIYKFYVDEDNKISWRYGFNTTNANRAETLHFTMTQSAQTAQNLIWLDDQMDLGYTVDRLNINADIDLADYEWKPINDSASNYSSNFSEGVNGGGYTIKNMTISTGATGEFVGFIGYSAGIISNLNFENATLNYTDTDGRWTNVIGNTPDGKHDWRPVDQQHLFGTDSSAYLSAGLISGRCAGMSYCSVKNGKIVTKLMSYTTGGGSVGYTGRELVGGLTGQCAGNISNCVADVDIEVHNSYLSFMYIGGITGGIGNNYTIDKCMFLSDAVNIVDKSNNECFIMFGGIAGANSVVSAENVESYTQSVYISSCLAKFTLNGRNYANESNRYAGSFQPLFGGIAISGESSTNTWWGYARFVSFRNVSLYKSFYDATSTSGFYSISVVRSQSEAVTENKYLYDKTTTLYGTFKAKKDWDKVVTTETAISQDEIPVYSGTRLLVKIVSSVSVTDNTSELLASKLFTGNYSSGVSGISANNISNVYVSNGKVYFSVTGNTTKRTYAAKGTQLYRVEYVG